jgi:hypothetical protein
MLCSNVWGSIPLVNQSEHAYAAALGSFLQQQLAAVAECRGIMDFAAKARGTM